MHEHEQAHHGGAECACDIGKADGGTRGALLAVLSLNGGMFLIQGIGGLILGSVALQADSLDFLADALGTLLTFRVLRETPRWRIGAAAAKGATMGIFGLVVFAETLVGIVAAAAPPAAIGVGGFGLLGLGVNVGSAALLFRYRAGDLNLRSLWLCLRNDAVASLAVIAAGLGIALTGSAWPDLVVGGGIALLRLRGAWDVLRAARAAWHAAPKPVKQG